MANSTREQQIQAIDACAKAAKKRWILIMVAIMAAIVLVVAAVCFFGMNYVPYALVVGILGLALTAKLCVEQIGKANQRQRNEMAKLDNKGRY